MPDFQQFAITRLANASISMPRWRIELIVTNSQTGEILRDFRGVDALTFPNVLGQLTDAQQDELVGMIAQWLILKRAGMA